MELAKRIRAVIRGHLMSVDKKIIPMKNSNQELCHTKNYSIIIGEKEVSFKHRELLFKFKYNQVKEFYLKNSNTFVFIRNNSKEMLLFRIE